MLVGAIVLYAAFPFYYAIVSSLKPSASMFEVSYWPRVWSFENYAAVFRAQPFARNILNSVLVSAAVVMISLGLSLTAAYALARVQFRGRTTLLLTILGVSMFPQIAVLSGMFELIRVLGLYNSLPGLALSYLIFTLPFSVWVLTTFMRELPIELEEAAVMERLSIRAHFYLDRRPAHRAGCDRADLRRQRTRTTVG
jgi:trehalose/maltose transport system permease protein